MGGKVKPEDKLVIGVDAQLGWPGAFQEITNSEKRLASGKTTNFPFNASARFIDNPLVFRKTEQFLKNKLGLKDPLSAVGDRIGNQASKAQYMLKCMRASGKSFYCPPFDSLGSGITSVTIIEVYPTASKASNCYTTNQTLWNKDRRYEDFKKPGDRNDAMHCALTAACYAATVGILKDTSIPKVWLPEKSSMSQSEGWIYCPKP